MASLELSRARAGQVELRRLDGFVVDDRLHRIQNGGVTLNFIDEHRLDALQGSETLFEFIGATLEVQVGLVIVQVDDQVRLELQDQGRLAHLPRAQQKHSLRALPDRSGNQSGYHMSILACKTDI